MAKQNNRQGFTLLELLVSATIIAVLTVIGVVSYSSVNKRSRDVKRKSDLEQIRSALEMFRSDNGSYPSVGSGSWRKVFNLNTGNSLTGLVSTYMPAMPEDPQPTTRFYLYEAKNIQSGNYYGYCVCACLESSPCTTVISNTCEAADVRSDCNYYQKNP
jgi:general secretion pathway protein G